MNRIFLTLALVANLSLGGAVWYGLSIHDNSGDLATVKHAVSMHLLVAEVVGEVKRIRKERGLDA